MHVDKGEERATDGAPGLPTGRGAECRPTEQGKSDLEPEGGRWGRAAHGSRGRGRGCDGLRVPSPGGLELSESTQPPVACRGFITGL